MNRLTKYILVFGTFLLLISSCVVISFYPIYTPDTLVKEDRILGKWESNDDGQIWHITLPDTILHDHFSDKKRNGLYEQTYLLRAYQEGDTNKYGDFWLHFIRINNVLYADFYPVDWTHDVDLVMFHHYSVHSFAKVTLGNELIINWFDPEWLKDIMDEKRIHIRHEKNETGDVLLTAKPKDLQKFIAKYGNKEAPFKDGYDLKFKRLEE